MGYCYKYTIPYSLYGYKIWLGTKNRMVGGIPRVWV